MKPVRTRFAPSPTGALHCGVVRTALFSWLMAKQSGGQFLLRIEDTDKVREVEGGHDNIKESLRWLGLEWDEGPDVDGPYAPYVQSERLDIYKKYAQELLDKGLAYADPYTKEELQALRDRAQAEKRPFLFREHRPTNPPKWDGSQPLRIKLEPKDWSWDDAVMGRVSMGPEMIDDYIIIKADGYPTYNFAHIIDDHLMKITHILRSQEFISSVPKFLATHEALGWESPINAIVPQVMEETGKRKLSKRFGAKPVLDYRTMGFLPEAMLNFMATIGWNDGTEQEIYTVDELIAKFSLDRVQKSGGIFDEKRLIYLNGVHIRRLSLDKLYERSHDFWPAEAANAGDEFKKQVLGLVQDRLKFLAELPELTTFFFAEPSKTDIANLLQNDKHVGNLTPSEITHQLQQAIQTLQASDFSIDDLQGRLNDLLSELSTKPAVTFSLLRIATTGAKASPGLFDTLHVLGKDKVISRLQKATQ